MIQREDIGPVTVFTYGREKFLTDPEPIKDMCSDLIENGRSQVVLDLGEVSLVTSMYLGGLISIVKLLRENGGALKLVHLQPAVSSVLEMTRLSRIMEIFNDRETAVKSFPS